MSSIIPKHPFIYQTIKKYILKPYTLYDSSCLILKLFPFNCAWLKLNKSLNCVTNLCHDLLVMTHHNPNKSFINHK